MARDPSPASNRGFHPSPLLGITTIEPTILSPTGADLSKLDADAVRATQRLISRGFEAYLVGGCVRDLLLDRTPKDYDIATEARPPQVKRTFARNCRIIGRRFKLAHLHFNNNTKILEVSTFRRSPELENPTGDDDLLITRDNEFGNAEEDALRRDFTVNALFLDPTRNCILDYTNGLADLRARLIRTIGDPRVRFREDPVRILRAAKFAGRLGFQIEAGTFAAMAETSGDLVRSAPPRLLEEILRLLRGGHALESYQLLRDVGALKCLVPVLADFLATARHDQRVAFWRLLEALDHAVHDGHVPQNGVLLGTLLVCPVMAKAEVNPGRSPSSIAEELLGPLSQSLRLPRRDAGCLKRICGVQHRFTETDEAKRFRMAGFVHGPYFDEALDLFELRVRAGAPGGDVLARWIELARTAGRHAPADDQAEGDLAEAQTYEEESEIPIDEPCRDEPASTAVESGDTPVGDPAAAEANAEPDAEAGQHDRGEPGSGPGRRRRRRRGRGRGRGNDQGFDAPSMASDAQRLDAAEQADVPPDTDRAQLDSAAEGVDVAESSHSEPRLQDSTAGDAPPADPATSEAGEPQAPDTAAEHGRSDGEGGFGEPGRRRRRRRGRGRGRDRDDRGGEAAGRFPISEPPTPHGEAIDAQAVHHEPPGRADTHLDPDAPLPEGEGSTSGAIDAAGQVAAGTSDQLTSDQVRSGQQGDDEDRHGRRRRRRGRRGRGRHGDGAQEGGQPHGERPPQQQRPQQQRPQQQQQQQQQQPHQQQQHQQQRGRQERRKDRHEHRDQRGRGHGAPRDVDVVPRYRDRRGKVDVIEPPPLDLSAFDVELDPKRVPTFGSIVEGKNRPTTRAPRVPEDGVDDYKPPPPPGSGTGPSAPPPPPKEPDTFGDW
ncbi:MAG: polynucleotide adenylyltransferase PcnB [Planctomycetota bacterium]|nr:polynucleotide adenylyltransferase PcnB [Planctomycetota bacterium]